jgi:integrase/recombinase XerD
MSAETPGAPCWRAQLARLEGAYSPMTIKNYRNGMKAFAAWCEGHRRRVFPASAEDVAAFVDDAAGRVKPATIRIALAGIGKLHRLARLPDPTPDEEVKLALRRAYRKHGRRQKQALPLSREIRDALVAACPSTLQGLRDRALLLTAYDTLCRRAELVAIEVAHLEASPDGGFHVFVPRSKNDPHGDGRMAHVSPRTRAAIEAWVDAACITEGPVFRGLRNGLVKDRALDPSEVACALKRVATSAGQPASLPAGLSGHSARVGAACDLAAGGADMLTIMRAGGWRSIATLARYVESVVVPRREDASASGEVRRDARHRPPADM